MVIKLQFQQFTLLLMNLSDGAAPMTIALAWVATRPDLRTDLYIATDSRTRGGFVLDLSPKILTLPRSDSALCFAGDTAYSYPLMLQIANAIAAHQPARNRNLDIGKLKSHLLQVTTDMIQSIADTSVPFEANDSKIILAGYSWRTRDFRIWTLHFDSRDHRFRARESKSFHVRLAKIAFLGDWSKKVRKELILELNRIPSGPPVEFEPLQVLSKLLRTAGPSDTIGGAPQVVRIGPHMNTRPFCVLWGPEKKPTLFGRTLFDYENCDYWTIDPDSGQIGRPAIFGSRAAEKAVQSENPIG